ncbi:hypothetical protein [Porphyromonas pogonae]|uniref:hypothetical protein n=1 Tax=Porphyromonas pogonae TaxID=867595 RepID=UPI002E766D53|nr:hypothetical protein [Porphyromonas pogonae]
MAYKRPLTNSQIACIILLWLVITVYILSRAILNGITIITLAMATFIVFYPIVKSIRQRRNDKR